MVVRKLYQSASSAKRRRRPVFLSMENGSVYKMKIKRKSLAAYYLMMLPGLIMLIMFNLVPLCGIVMAFQKFSPGKGILGSPWIGLENFQYMFSMRDTWSILYNTIYIAFFKIIGNLLVPLAFALILNEVRHLWFKRAVQTIVYLPHFLSWVILASIVLNIFGYNGPVNEVISVLGGERVMFFANEKLFPWMIIITDIWKEYGFNAVIYLAALTGIDQSLYEAAMVDGAGRWKQLCHITLPEIRTTVVLLAVLALGNVMNANFDQIFNLYNPLVYSTGDIIDTWVYRTGLVNLQFSLATAVGVLKSVVGFALISISYFLASKFADYHIF